MKNRTPRKSLTPVRVRSVGYTEMVPGRNGLPVEKTFPALPPRPPLANLSRNHPDHGMTPAAHEAAKSARKAA